MRISSVLCFAPFFFLAAILSAHRQMPRDWPIVTQVQRGKAKFHSRPSLANGQAMPVGRGALRVLSLDPESAQKRKSLLRGASLKRPVKNRYACEMSLAGG